MAWTANFDDFQPQKARTPSGSISWTGGPKNTTGKIGFSEQSGGKQLGGYGQEDVSDIRSIADLSPGILNSKIIGVIISMEEPRHFLSKKDVNSERHVFSFTLRDSPNDFINVSCWGGEQFVKNLASNCHIGSVVELDHAIIQTKPADGSDERFRPWTPSAFQVSLSEMRGTLTSSNIWNKDEYLRLLQVPVKPGNDFYTIADILTNGPGLSGQVISMLAVVREVAMVKHFKSKNGRQLQRCDVLLFDDSAPAFTLFLWDKELIEMAQSWTPKANIIFAADVRVTYDDWKKTMVATAIAKTITVNPDTREAHRLYQYAQSVDLGSQEFDVSIGQNDLTVPLSQIDEVYKVDQLKDVHLLKSDNRAVHGIVYAFISLLNIDDSPSSVVSLRCTQCHFRIAKNSPMCTNQNCPSATDPRRNEFTKVYDIRVSLTDETGTLADCILAEDVAEKMLGCSVEEFINMSDVKKTELKWKFLLERCKVYVKVPLPSQEKKKSARILSCDLVDVQEVVATYNTSR